MLQWLRRRSLSLAKLARVWLGNHFSACKPLAGPTILLDFNDCGIHRRFHVTLAYCLSHMPARIQWRFRLRFIAFAGDCDNIQWWRKLPFKFVTSGVKRLAPDIIITDRPDIFREGCHRVIEVLPIDGNEPHQDTSKNADLPFLAHPRFLLSGNYDASTDNESSNLPTRRHRVGFAGNCDVASYESHPELTKRGLIPRKIAVDSVQKTFADRTEVIRVWDDKRRLKDTEHEIVIVDAYKAGLTFEEYNCFFNTTDFALILPGIGCPFTHSLHETTTCGSIPIMQESCVSDNIWHDRQDCLLYSDIDSLHAAIGWALTATQNEIDELRRRMLALISDLFNPRKIGTRLTRPGIKTIRLRNC